MTVREGSLEAPTRHPLDWRNPDFYDHASLDKELERVFDICHGCRRCVSLCSAFPTLFDLIDESKTGEVDGVAKADYGKVVDQCYLCDVCYMTKCPYVPPHPWNVDFPHLMLRAKAVKFRDGDVQFRDKLLTSTDRIGKLASIPVVVQMVNAANTSPAMRKVMEKVLGVAAQDAAAAVHERALPVARRAVDRVAGPRRRSARRARSRSSRPATSTTTNPASATTSSSCSCTTRFPTSWSRRRPAAACRSSNWATSKPSRSSKDVNIPPLAALARAGYAILTSVPSCTLMFKQELPLMFPEDADVKAVADAMFDPFEYLVARDRDGLLKTDFRNRSARSATTSPAIRACRTWARRRARCCNGCRVPK